MSTGGIVVADRETASPAASVAGPVMLLTCNVPFEAAAVEVAVDAAGESGAELYICDAIPLGSFAYIDQMARVFAEHANRRELDAVATGLRLWNAICVVRIPLLRASLATASSSRRLACSANTRAIWSMYANDPSGMASQM